MTPAPAPASLDELLLSREVVICCGSGGVGKTTLSASLALRAAMLGRKAIVCTIDPAKRLANSLGLSDIGNEDREVPRERLAAAQLEPKGALWALMLDTKRQFDDLIGKFAKSEETRQRILQNRFYQTITGNVVGSQEFAAMEKLYELHSQRRYDLIVLDTPPTKHAIDFLTAPQRMQDVLDRSVIDVLMRPFEAVRSMSLGVLARAAKKFAKKIDQAIGVQFVHDLAEFFQAFETLYDGFRDRAQKVNALLREPFTSFVVVSSPLAIPLREARFFCEKLRELDLPLAGVIVNRVQESLLDAAPAAREPVLRLVSDESARRAAVAAAKATAGEPLGSALACAVEALVAQEHLAQEDRVRIDELKRGAAAGLLVREIPRFGGDVYDLAGLKHLNEHLFGETG